ncbi:MAG: hypothetical protein R2699_11455 [Acidimicrobiales bacterium]
MASSNRSLPVITTGSTVTCTVLSGVSKLPTSGGPSRAIGTISAMPPSTWARPMVAMVRVSREALAKRRMTMRSTKNPMATPRATATPTATNHGTPSDPW